MSSIDRRETALREIAMRLMDKTRVLGIERGFTLALDLLYTRWEIEQSADGRVNDGAPSVAADSSAAIRIRSLLNGIDKAIDVPALDQQLRVDPGLAGSLLADIEQAISSMGDHQEVLVELVEHMLLLQDRAKSAVFAEHASPKWLADLLSGAVGGGKRSIDPMCGMGSTLLAMARQGASWVDGCELNVEAARVARVRLRMAGVSGEVRAGNLLWQAQDYIADYDSVVMHPPWGLRLTTDDRSQLDALGIHTRSSRAGHDVWLTLAAKFLRPDGRAAVVLPQGEIEQETLQALLEKNAIEAVVAFPSGFLGSTSMRGAAWILRPPSAQTSAVLMVDTMSLAGSDGVRTSTLSNDDVKQVLAWLDDFRASGAVDAPGYVASIVNPGELLTGGPWPPLHLEEAPEVEAVVPETPGHLLSALRIGGYKSFGGVREVPLAPITLVYGANSAGKSSLMQSLLLLKQSVEESGFVTQGEVANVGGFTGITHGHRQEPVQFGLTFASPVWDLPPGGTADPSQVRHVDLEFNGGPDGRGRSTEIQVAVGDLRMVFLEVPDGLALEVESAQGAFEELGRGTFLYPFDTRKSTTGDPAQRDRQRRSQGRSAHSSVVKSGIGEIVVSRDGLLPSSRVVSAYPRSVSERQDSVSKSYIDRLAQLNAGVGAELRSLLSDLTYLGPLRSAPQRFYERAAQRTQPGDGHDVAMYLFDNSTAIDHVNQWLNLLEVPYELDVVPVTIGNNIGIVGDLVAMTLTDSRSGVVVTPADVGFGISQMLPIVVELLARRESIICIEQPETHLHPRLQARLADLLVETTEFTGRANQLLVETHSEHLLLRLQRRIREGALNADHVCVLYVDQNADGVATVARLRMDEDGDFIDEWPHGFFDDRIEELLGDLS